MNAYEHLHPSAVRLFDLSDEERRALCRKKKWIPYGGAKKAYAKLEELLACDREQRPECLLLLSPTGNGKSMILEEFSKAHPAQDNIDGEAALVPVLYYEMPDDATVNDVMLELLRMFHSPLNAKSPKPDRRRELFSLMEKSEVKVLLIDELHHLSTATPAERLKILTFFKMIGNGPRIHVVAAGTQEAKRILASVPELLSRFTERKLPLWTMNDDFRELLASFEYLLPLKRASGLGEIDALAQYIHHKSDGMIGEVFKLLYQAAQRAIDTGEEAITLEILHELKYESLTERKYEVIDLDP